jgi:hypothetical protein
MKHALAGEVGAPGFEPGTPWSQTRYTTGLCYTPNKLFGVVHCCKTFLKGTRNYIKIATNKTLFFAFFLFVIRQGLEPRTVSLEG